MEVGTTTIIVIDKVLGLLTNDEASSFRGLLVPELVEDLEIKLKMVQTKIESIDACDDKDGEEWLNQVAEVVQRLELVIDTYLLHAGQRQYQPDSIVKWESGHSVASQIQHIIVNLRPLKGFLGRYGKHFIQPSSKVSKYVDSFVGSSLFIKESEVVGIDYQREQLRSVVVGEVPSRRSVIALVGIGGLGKTTLANIVYRDVVKRKRCVRQKNHFDCCAQIFLSRSYNFEKLLRSLIEEICTCARDCICRGIDMVTLEVLSRRLNRFLSRKRYFIVLDDVWKTDFWKYISPILPNNNKGSRIIITTRHNSIADSCDIVHNIQPLTQDRALELFCKRAFVLNCPLELKELSFECVRSCHGLPPIINAIARFLSTEKKVITLWPRLLDNFGVELEKMPFFNNIASQILSPSYDDLPFHIRACLLYFGVFPEDFLVSDLKLFKLWIAEGFVKEETGKTLEQVAATYLNELIDRNLVQVSYINYCSMERMCRVTGVIRDIILSKAKDFGICQNTKNRSLRRKIRCLSICGDTEDIVKNIHNSEVRSIFFFKGNEPMSLPSVINLFERFKLLELLDFENASLDYLPDEVGNLFLLKYLSLRNTKVKKLPNSICLLLNLQTLDVRNTLMHDLPVQILKLRKLQHLLANAYYDNSIHGVKIKEGIGCLENLQTLLTVEAQTSALGIIEDLEKLRKLRWLGISKLTSVIVNSLCNTIEKMNHLEYLSLYSSKAYETFDLESISSPPPSLRHLILKCRLEKLPGWIRRLQNLTVLCLSFSRLAVDPLKAIHDLPNLISLWLHQAYIGEQLHFEEASFPKLKQLVLTELYDMRMMRIDIEALPLLEELRIGPCPAEFSSNIQQLRNLQVLEFCDMPDEFVLRLQPKGGSNYWQVEHVLSVIFRYRIHEMCVSYKLGEPDLLAHVKGLVETKTVDVHDRPLGFSYKDDVELATASSAKWSEHGSIVYKDDEELPTASSARWSEQMSFFYKDDEELATSSSARWSEQGSFFSDDIED